MRRDREFDLHIWAKPENKNMAALYTVSRGRSAICIDMPIDEAIDFIRQELEEAE